MVLKVWGVFRVLSRMEIWVRGLGASGFSMKHGFPTAGMDETEANRLQAEADLHEDEPAATMG